MNLVWKFLNNMRWFFISAVIIFFIAIGLSHFDASRLNGSFVALVENHQVFWLFVRLVIILLFILFWPAMVNRWAKQYDWPEAYVTAVKKRRWRYAIWLMIIDLVFQLL